MRISLSVALNRIIKERIGCNSDRSTAGEDGCYFLSRWILNSTS